MHTLARLDAVALCLLCFALLCLLAFWLLACLLAGWLACLLACMQSRGGDETLWGRTTSISPGLSEVLLEVLHSCEGQPEKQDFYTKFLLKVLFVSFSCVIGKTQHHMKL